MGIHDEARTYATASHAWGLLGIAILLLALALPTDRLQTPTTLLLGIACLSLGVRERFGPLAHATGPASPDPATSLPERHLQGILACVDEAVVTTDADARVLELNAVAERLTGWDRHEARGQWIENVVVVVAGTPEEAMSSRRWVTPPGVPQLGGGEVWLRHRDGQRIAIEGSACPLADASGAVQGGVLVFRDVGAARQLAGQLSHQATHDVLTDLINRQAFEKLLDKTLADPAPHPAGHALLYLDLDQFKVVNDTCGHAAGDELLRQVTALLEGIVRASDSLGRLGGDEFAVLLRDCPLDSALRVADKIRQAIADHRFAWADRSFALGASIGLVHFDATAAAAPILSAADAACFIAKDKGRNRVHVHDRRDEATARRSGELDWASRIDGALRHDRFVLYGQRIAPVDARPGNGHYELLVRMRDEQGALVPPMAFLPAAERYGLMPAIDRWVVRQAFTTLAAARAEGAMHLRFSINLSGASLNDEAFLGFLQAQFEAHSIPHALICFEVTETTAIANLDNAARLIDALRGLGCKFSLDDFGSGMSSFGYLKHLRIDYLKIDGAFVKDIVTDRIDAAMVEAIHRVGQALGLETIAEFVENDAILERLRELGVDYAQGYGIHVPQPLSAILSGYSAAAAAGACAH
jgi:diguanylate cyclase (GGDEF)-like protein/PAS domain S-box-containing protein